MSKKKRKAFGKPKSGKLELWQHRLAQADSAYSPEVERMNVREKLFNGDRKLKQLVPGDKKDQTTPHVRNIIFENIESEVSSSIPKPKVTARRKQDEHLAQIIENFIRNELDRMPFETMNDMAERTVPIQGGTLWMVEWDQNKRSHDTLGAMDVSLIHPKQLAPQPGIYTGVEDMDWVILKIPTTKSAIWRKYRKNVYQEMEAEPEIRGTGNEDTCEDALTQYVGFERSREGGINRYSWVNDVELEDLVNYQARRQPVCRRCGAVRPLPGQVLTGYEEPQEETEDFLSGGVAEQTQHEEKSYDGGACPWCGCGEWEEQEMEYEQVFLPVRTNLGKVIPGEHPEPDEMGNLILTPTKIPFYRPDLYPLVLQRSVSVYGQLLGNSDVDVIADQQNTINRLEKKIIDRLMKAGTRVSLPDNARLRMDPRDGEIWYLRNAADKNMIGLYEFKGNLQYELTYLGMVYEESRQILGITDSFQGRKDSTATSGKAKEYSAAQAAGRLESKRVMKQAAYAALFELMFKWQLAYADEPRPVTYKDHNGDTVYEEFNRYDFLEQDASGQWYWNDNFLFSCDSAEPLANNREAMWQETRQNLQSGAFGDPTSTQTLILFWNKMELLHYPGAGETKRFLEDRLQQEQAQQLQMMQLQLARQGIPGTGQGMPAAPGAGNTMPGAM